MSLFASNPFDVLKAETLFRQQYRVEGEDGQPDEFGQIGDAGQPTAPDSNGDCPPCMKLGKGESTDDKGNRVEKDICVPACDSAKGEVCYIHPCVNNQGWTCLSPSPVGGGGSRIVFPSNLTTTCGEEGYTGNGKACPCVVCNNTVAIANCRDDCRTCSQVQGATNLGQAANNRQLCGSSLGNVLITGAGQGQGHLPTPPSGTIWGFLEDTDVCQCPAGAQRVAAPEICPTCEKCANVGCTDPEAENYDPNATITCGEGTLWPNRCCVYPPPPPPSCNDPDACNKHFTDGANMNCMFIQYDTCEPVCSDSSATDYPSGLYGYGEVMAASGVMKLYYANKSKEYDWSLTGKPLGQEESWAQKQTYLTGRPQSEDLKDSNGNGVSDTAERFALQKEATNLFFKPCTGCPEGEAWSQLGMCEKLGCTHSRACNWDSAAKVDDGSCEYESCTGCMMTGADNYDPNATIPCSDDISGLPNSCCEKDACSDKNSCQYDRWCAGPMTNSSNMTKCNTSACKSCKKGYKMNSAGNGCKKCADDDEDEECYLGCSATENSTTNSISTFTKSVGNAILGANTVKVGGISLLTWGVIGLVVGGVVAASAE